MADDWLAPALAYIPEWLAYQCRQNELPGVSLAIAQAGEPVLVRAFGLANLAAGERLTPAHRFRVASHSKTFTAVGIMRLVEAGRLRLDDAVGQHVAGLHPEVAAATLRQLLSHTAGLTRDGTDTGQWAQRRPFLNEAELRAALAEAPVIDANTRMKYSNHGFGLLGLVIAAATGEPYNAWIAREVVAAAGLRHTQPDPPLARGAKLSQGHLPKVLLGQRVTVPADTPTHALASATGFISTAEDLARFFATLDPAAPASLLSAASRRELARPHWRIPDMAVEGHYGLGTILGSLGEWRWFGHSGGFPGVTTQTAVLPAQRLTISVLTNATDGAPRALLDGCLHILQAFQRHGPPEAALAGWSGRWWGLAGPVDLVAMGGRVMVAVPGQPNPFADTSELTAAGADEARISRATGFGSFGEAVRLRRDGRARVAAVEFAGARLLPEAALAREVRARYGL